MKKTQKSKMSAWELSSLSDAFYVSNNDNRFSSSMPVLSHSKLNFKDSCSGIQSMNDTSSESNLLNDNIKTHVPADDIDLQGVGIILPGDEEELLAGIADDFDLNGLPNQVEELDDDLFCSIGGLELDSDPIEGVTVGMAKTIISEGHMSNGIKHHNLQNGVSAIAGEHPLGEHPSRTLFVRNINSNVEDSELRALFEQYGDIRNIYTLCKNRGFVMISYYDIRDARTAMHALQNKPLRRRKLDIHFSIPKVNPSDKDINQGTLVIFNLDPSVSNDDIEQIFGAYGEIKEIRETPHKRHHKFIEFYDVRAAEAALRSLNKSDIAGKRIKLEPSRPGGARRSLMQQLNHDLEQDESRVHWDHGSSPLTHSPPGSWLQFGSPGDVRAFHALNKSPNMVEMSSTGCNSLQGLASTLPPMVSNSVKIAPIGKDQNRFIHSDQVFSRGNVSQIGGFQHSHSLPVHSSGMMSPSFGSLSSLGPSSSDASGIGTLSGSQFLWGSLTPFMERAQPSWQSRNMGVSSMSNSQSQGQNMLYSSPRGSFPVSSHNNSTRHSAPSVVRLEKHYGFPESPDISFMSPVGFGNIGVSQNKRDLMMNRSPQGTMNSGFVDSGNIPDDTFSNFGMMYSQRFGPFLGNAPFPGITSMGAEGLVDRNRNQRVEGQGNQVDNKKQYQLDLEKIVKGEDTRTTLMIRNIPNKYTSKMLLAAIDENHKGTYDFLYLPIDFKNNCNVGYAFINMVSPSHIITFYETFDGKKWEKFNSEKVASLAYARIQGRAALVAHFQNSSLMNEDKRCRPIIFDADGLEVGNQEAFQLSDLSVHTHQQIGINSEVTDMAESRQLTNLSRKSEHTNQLGSGL